MIELDLDTAAQWTGGRLAGAAARGVFRGVSTDTRTLAAGNLFVALRGPSFDGHDFAATAVRAGAAGLVVDHAVEAELPQVVVDDTRAALGRLGSAWRARFAIPVIAVTGSNGKTTVKECIGAVLRQSGPALVTRGNLNNDIGVPLMLCELGPEHTAAVFELGANHPGEIDTLARLVTPNVGLVTNAAAAHLEGFGSVEGVARAKGELFAALPAQGTAVIAVDEPWADLWRELAGEHRRVSFAVVAEADVRAAAAEDGIVLEISGERRRVAFPLAGAHNVRNAAAAAAAAWAAGLDTDTIARGLAAVEPVAGRLVRRDGPGGSTLLDDTYNANPGSFAAAFGVLAGQPGRRWAVVGEMGELGDATRDEHRRLGQAAREAGVEHLWAFGPSAAQTCDGFGAGAATVEDLDALAEHLGARLDGDVTLLVKGSRSNRLEHLVERLQRVTKPMTDAGSQRPCC